MDGFQIKKADDINAIIIKLLSPEDIALKTEIDKPRALAILSSIADAFRQEGYKQTADFLDAYVAHYLKYQVSKGRQSRKEIEHILSEAVKREMTTAEKLTTPVV